MGTCKGRRPPSPFRVPAPRWIRRCVPKQILNDHSGVGFAVPSPTPADDENGESCREGGDAGGEPALEDGDEHDY